MEKLQHSARSVRDQSPPRKIERSRQHLKEKEWFAAEYLKPRGVSQKAATKDLSSFTHLIWESPTRLMIPEYGSTADEMAKLCGEGADGWLLSSHMIWIMDKVNRIQDESLCLCLSASSPQEMFQLAQGRNTDKLRRLIFIANVGRDPDGTVFFSSTHRSGCHWVLITVELTDRPTILYCDSLAWSCPKDFLNTLSLYTAPFGLLSLCECDLCVLHEPVSSGKHFCSVKCRNYPLQTCTNVCGVVALVCAVVAALDCNLFATLTGPRCGLQIYLHDPTKYERFLRRVLISWFITGDLDVSMLHVNMNLTTCTSVWSKNRLAAMDDHIYSTPPTKSQKRKSSDTMSHTTPKHANTCSSSISSQQTQTQYKTIGCSSESLTSNQTCLDTIKENDTKMPREEDHCISSDIDMPSLTYTCSQSSDSKATTGHTSSSSKEKKEILCEFCNTKFSHRQSLEKHRKRKHSEQLTKKDNASSVSCQICFEPQSSKVQDLIFHYNNKHQKHIQVMNKTFSHAEEFKQWKKNTEKETSTKFKKACGDVQILQNKLSYYRCHRSGKKVLVKNPSRFRKSQGSCKIDNRCTAFMNVRTNMQNLTINVEYCLHHIGHGFKLGHQTLSSDLRTCIAGKLAQGLDPGKILDDIRDKITQVNRDSMVTRKDIHNIRNQYNISHTQKHKEDGQSVDIWVQELQREANNPVISYKAQGTSHDILNDEDFLLCIQTDFQRNMMTKFASQFVCVDSTHKTTQYDFYLTTILVLDEFEEAVPVAWAISNREDAEILELFMNALKISCGQDIVTEFFMSDLANSFYNAWCVTFSRPIKRLYCSWHVDKSWRKKISEIIPLQLVQCNTYAYLKTLQSEPNETCFRKMLQEFLQYLEEHSPAFKDYFLKQYINDGTMYFWAACFRIGTHANTNMFAEAFHRVLKDIYFSRKQNRRVDNLLVILLKIARDKALEQLIKLEKGKVTHRVREIRIRHNNSDSVTNIEKSTEQEGEWTVPSSRKSDLFYSVRRVNENQLCKCKLICDLCFVCVHMYTCTCTDFLTKTVSCKHIHAVHKMFSSHSEETQQCEDVDSKNFLKSVITQENPEASDNVEKLRTASLSRMNDIRDLIVNSSNICMLREILKRLSDTYSIGCGMQQTAASASDNNFQKKDSFPSNKNFEPQKRFFSTKRKCKVNRSKLKLKKPDDHHKDKIKDDLSSSSAKLCAICFCEDDKTNDAEVKWFQCTSCQCLIHVACDIQIEDHKDIVTCSVCFSRCA